MPQFVLILLIIHRLIAITRVLKHWLQNPPVGIGHDTATAHAIRTSGTDQQIDESVPLPITILNPS